MASELIAITNRPSPSIANGERSFIDRDPIDYDAALAQHQGYRDALADCGAAVTLLDVNQECADGVFVEDTAIVLDEVAIMMSPGAESRRPEPEAIEPELAKYREVWRIALPATIDGGDVQVVGKKILVGASARTNLGGIERLREFAKRCGYSVIPIPVVNCLHLKSACTALPDGRLVVHPDLIDRSELKGFHVVEVPRAEQWAADVLSINERVIVSDAYPRTATVIANTGFEVVPVDVSEFAKAEGGVTCMSLVFSA